MINIVSTIEIRSLDSGESSFRLLPLIPGSGTLSETIEATEHGRLKTISMKAGLKADAEGLSDNLEVLITTDTGKVLKAGSGELPVRLKISRENTIIISLEYKESAI